MAIYKSHISETYVAGGYTSSEIFSRFRTQGIVEGVGGVGGVSKAVKVTQGSSKVRPWESI